MQNYKLAFSKWIALFHCFLQVKIQSLIILIVKGNVVVVAAPLELELRRGRVSEVMGAWRCHITRHRKRGRT
jgi:hypothetical protein